MLEAIIPTDLRTNETKRKINIKTDKTQLKEQNTSHMLQSLPAILHGQSNY